MEQKPEGTPNPLNPNMDEAPLDANPSETLQPTEAPQAAEAANDVVSPVQPAKKFKPLRPMSSVRPRGPIDMVRPISKEMQRVKPASKARATFIVDSVASGAGLVSDADVKASEPPLTPPMEPPMAPPMAPSMTPPMAPMAKVEPMPTNAPLHEVETASSSDSMSVPQPMPTPAPAPISRPAPAPADTLGVVTNMDGTVAETIDPTVRPMQRAATKMPKPAKKRTRKSLAVVAILCLFLAIGCGVAAALVFISGNRPDDVALAVERIAKGEAPTNVMIDGTVNINVNDVNSPLSSVKLKVSTEMITKSLINSTIVKLDAKTRSGQSFTTTFSEMYAANGDVYLKIDGADEFLAETSTPGAVATPVTPTVESTTVESITDGEGNEAIEISEEVDCRAGDDCPSSSNGSGSVNSGSVATPLNNDVMMKALTELFETVEAVDGEWLRIPVEDLGTLLPAINTSDDGLICAAKFMVDANSDSSILSSSYLNHPFIYSTDKEISVNSERDPIYKVLIDDSRLGNFAIEAQKSSALGNLTNCLGYEGSVSDALVTEAHNLPEIFVEVNEDHNFTRLYFTSEITKLSSNCCPEGEQCIQGCTDISSNGPDVTITTDLKFSYPTNINVPEPTEYRNLSTVIQEVDQTIQNEQEAAQEVPPVENPGAQQR